MRNKSLTLLTCLRIVHMAIGFILVLAGCATAYHGTSPTTVLPASGRNSARRTPAPQSHPVLAKATATPPLVTLPEAGGPHPTIQAQPVTPLPPTLEPVKPTAIPTQMPAANSPTPVQNFAPTRIIIPAINLDAPVIAVGWSVAEENGQPVSEWDVPSERAAGWLNTSAPVGAQGNTVLVGHQDIDGQVFGELAYLRLGDEIQVQAATETHKYVIAARTIVLEKDQPLEVRQENARWIGRSNDERLTLVTCWPRNDNTHRLILVALPAG